MFGCCWEGGWAGREQCLEEEDPVTSLDFNQTDNPYVWEMWRGESSLHIRCSPVSSSLSAWKPEKFGGLSYANKLTYGAWSRWLQRGVYTSHKAQGVNFTNIFFRLFLEYSSGSYSSLVKKYVKFYRIGYRLRCFFGTHKAWQTAHKFSEQQFWVWVLGYNFVPSEWNNVGDIERGIFLPNAVRWHLLAWRAKFGEIGPTVILINLLFTP